MLRALAIRIRTLLRPASVDRELEAEIRYHLEREIERNVAKGMREDDAAWAARRAFGNATATKEAARDALGWLWLDHLRQDIRYAVRGFRNAPGFTFVAVLSLALGATVSQVLRMVLREGVVLVIAGLALGTPLTFAARRLIAVRLVGLTATDPATIAVASVFMLVMATVAALLPAWRAAAVDPLIALRHE